MAATLAAAAGCVVLYTFFRQISPQVFPTLVDGYGQKVKSVASVRVRQKAKLAEEECLQ